MKSKELIDQMVRQMVVNHIHLQLPIIILPLEQKLEELINTDPTMGELN